MTQQPFPPQQPPRQGRGCFFYGCITAIILVLVLVVAGSFIIGGVRAFVKAAVDNYTETRPRELPKVEISEDDLARLQARVKAFTTAVDQQKPGASLALTEKEINALIAHDPDFKELKDKVYVAIEGDQIKGQISYPLGKLGPLDLTGRYLNGEATFKIALQGGMLFVMMQSLTVAGKQPPEAFMQALRQENLAKEACKDPDTAKALAKLDSIVVRDGCLIIAGRAP
ncbi:MAG: hypothetical protein N2689_14250 [Verrucomicrobiae bacterium]|nr:hypothetical protein [Verrucomicrobiae bacterium]